MYGLCCFCFGLQNDICFPSFIYVNKFRAMAFNDDDSDGNQLIHLASVLSGSPDSKRELERMSREIGNGKFPLKSREKVEEPLQEGLSYLHVQANALLLVSNLLGRLEGLVEHLEVGEGIRGVLKEIQVDLTLLEDTNFNGFATFVRADGTANRETFSLPGKLGKGWIRQLNLHELLERILSAAEPDDLDIDAVREAKLGVNELIGQIRARVDELVENFRIYSEKFVENGKAAIGNKGKEGRNSWLSILLKDEFALEIQANLESDVVRFLQPETKN